MFGSSASHFLFIIIFTVLIVTESKINSFRRQDIKSTTGSTTGYTHSLCADMGSGSQLRARRKSCFLRPDTGPCRADIVQWYFDAKQSKCYRFFWGGCQGNGNRFTSQPQCFDYCYLNTSNPIAEIPHFCQLSYDYGSCFGHYIRWSWDNFSKTCKRRLYSGCGGNQNNFETMSECLKTCLTPPANALTKPNDTQGTTCIPWAE